MALVVGSSSTSAFAAIFAGGNTIQVVLTKPSGLAVGDLMVAQYLDDGGYAVATSSGFTQIISTQNATNGNRSTLYYKIATSGDAAASSFTFSAGTTTGTGTVVGGAMVRITGASSSLPIWASSGDGSINNTAAPSFNNTITPAVANSMLLLFASAQQNGNNISGYAIVTSNPTWTEQWDFTNNPGTSYSSSMAYAVRSQTTATGNSSITGGAASSDWVGQLVAIAPDKSFSQLDSVAISETMSNLRSRIFTILETVITSDNISSLVQRVWNKITRNNSTFTDSSKHTSVFTNSSKHNSSWSDQDKAD